MIPILITCAIKVNAPYTQLSNAQERLELLISSIIQWNNINGVKRLVICDGSGYDLTEHIVGLNLNNIEYEILNFTNDIEDVKKFGKGYGEGQIVEYAIKNSKFIKESSHFAKCTGKLWVDNYIDCLNNYNGNYFFDYHGRFSPISIDTRFYIINKEYFINNIMNLYKCVDDKNFIYLENAYLLFFKRLKIANFISYPVPLIRGVSGSTGLPHKVDKIRIFIKNIKHYILKNI